MTEISDGGSKAGIRSAEIFREIIRTGSTRRAAKELGITQSAVSQHLKQFEEAVGEKLFERDRRGLIPTTRAIDIYNRLDRYFETLGRIEREITDAFRVKRNSLTIAAPDILTLTLVPKVIRALDDLDPSLEFHVKAQRYDQITQSILTGEADIGISRLPLDERFFEWQIIAESKSVCLLPHDHRLASKDVITVDDISEERLIVLEREYASNKLGFLTFGRGNFSLSPKVYTDTIGLSAVYVTHGIGISLDNSFMAEQYKMFDVKIVPFQPATTYEYVVCWHRGNDKFSRDSAIVATLMAVIENERSSARQSS